MDKWSLRKLHGVLEKALTGDYPDKEDCKYLLNFHEASLEASLTRAAANELIRRKNQNTAIILGQVGICASECEGSCKFCTFGEGHATVAPFRLTQEEIRQKVLSFCDKDDLYGLFLMTMHDYDLYYFLDAVKTAQSVINPLTKVWANVGDSGSPAFREMKKAGIDGIYHVCRLGEGVDTKLNPKDRVKTMEKALDAGLKLYTCLEPIGPEHTPEELVENMFIGIDLHCTQHAAMRRTATPGTPLANKGQISELRLAQIVAVVALAAYNSPNMTHIGVHEPNQLAYVSGANIITAETGANPRDTILETSKNRGMDMAACRKMLLECGFSVYQLQEER